MNHLPTIDVNKRQLGEVHFIFPDEPCRFFVWGGRDLAYLKQHMYQQSGQKREWGGSKKSRKVVGKNVSREMSKNQVAPQKK